MVGESQKRDEVRSAYPGKKWKDKVDKMSETQVAAIHFRLVQQKIRSIK